MQLTDRFGRVHDYLRISLTDKCNLRCLYCMPAEDMQFMPTTKLMQAEEILEIAQRFVALGIRKVRLTGGEPLVRKDVGDIIRSLGNLPVDLHITTNGILLDRYFNTLSQAGVTEINLSLDTLDRGKFERMTRRDQFDIVMSNLQEALRRGFKVKINCVMLKEENEEDLMDFVELSREMPVQVRFIEYMPFNGNNWDFHKVIKWNDIYDKIQEDYKTISIPVDKKDTSRNFRIKGGLGTFGFISTITKPFCSGCNRIRLTADGKIKNCLFSTQHLDLLSEIRKGNPIEPIIMKAIGNKAYSRGGHSEFDKKNASREYENNLKMIEIGG